MNDFRKNAPCLLLKLNKPWILCILFCSVALLSRGAENAHILLQTNDLSKFIVPKGNNQYNWYVVEDGVLQLRSSPNRKHSVLKTKEVFTDFRFRFEFRFIEGNIDSGIELRNNDQIQIGISGSLKRDMTGSPYIPGLGYPKHAKGVDKLLNSKDWNQMTIICEGPRYRVNLAGNEILDYQSPRAIPKGPIGIQLHGNRDMKIDFRRFLVEKL
jgi:hypothetical protein